MAKAKNEEVKKEKLKNKVEKALAQDKELSKSYDINVDVIDGDVHLSGIVDTLADKNRAERLVRSVPEVQYLDNDLTISTDGAITDKGVEFEVSEELQADPRVNTKHIGAKSSRGKVFLVGHSDDPEEIKAAQEAASRARGVKEVISQVKPVKQDPETYLFHSQVRNDQEETDAHE